MRKFTGVSILFFILSAQICAVDIAIDKTYATDYESFHVLEGVAHLSSPLNLFPQLGLGLQTNHTWPVFIGAKVGVSGPLITAGWYYGQADIYANVNLFEVSKLHWYFGAKQIWREHYFITPYIDGKINDFTSAVMSQVNYVAHIGVWHKIFFIELGWEFVGYRSISVSPAKPHDYTPTAEEQARINDASAKTAKTMGDLARYSAFHFSIGASIRLF